MRNFRTEGIVIRRRNFQDADRIITIFTKEHGKLQIKASGIRKISSRRSPHVELLNYSIVNLYNGNKFPILTEAQTIESFSVIKADLEKIGLAYHLCELIDGLCPENQENRGVFELLKNTLSKLSCHSESFDSLRSVGITKIINEFEVELLSLLGYWNKADFLTDKVDIDHFVENILERKLKSKAIFAKL
ncbi:MAG TPA: DNA repair protein RecO [Methylomirabilota bacterium]|nr:DNA repair protein RecO [Methylomirabilota bacterium]